MNKNRKIRRHAHYATKFAVEICRVALPIIPLRFTYSELVTRMIGNAVFENAWAARPSARYQRRYWVKGSD